MTDAEEVDAYAPAATQACLDAIDNTRVDRGFLLGRISGRLLDIGMGPGGIPLKIARRLPNTHGVSISRSVGIG